MSNKKYLQLDSPDLYLNLQTKISTIQKNIRKSYFNLIKKAIVSTQHNQIKGQFEYYNLKGHPDDMEVMLIDDEGNIVARTNTDRDGNFSFDYLPIDKTYTIKVNDEGEVVKHKSLTNSEILGILATNPLVLSPSATRVFSCVELQ